MNAIRKSLWLAAFGAAAVMGTTPANADDWSFSIGGRGQWVEPVYATQPRTILVPARYEERSREIWREPVYEDRRTLVTVPPRTEIRDVPRFIHGRFAGYDRQTVVVESGRQEWRTDRVLIQPGRWETVYDRVLVEPERTQVVYDQVLVTPGYWESAQGVSFGYFGHNRHDDDDDDDHGRWRHSPPRGAKRVRR